MKFECYATYLEDVAEALDDLRDEEEKRSLFPMRAEVEATLPIFNNGSEVVKRQKEEKLKKRIDKKGDFTILEFSGTEIKELYQEEKDVKQEDDIREVEAYPVLVADKEGNELKQKAARFAPMPEKYRKEIQKAKIARSGIGYVEDG